MPSDIANDKPDTTKVWDLVIRLFHWVLVTTFIVAYLTEDDFLDLHVLAGYILGAAIMVRLLWGFVGTKHARFSDFVTSPGVAFTYLKETLSFKANRYVGHNPAGGLMIVLMLSSLTFTAITGVALYGAEEHAGPMASWFLGSSADWEGALEEAHEFLANFTLLLVAIHLIGVITESLVHKENLIRAMISGVKRST